WALVRGVARVTEHEGAIAREERAVARVACREHAIEQIDTGRDEANEVSRRPRSHEVTRAIRGQERGGRRRDREGLRSRLTDREATDGIPIERQLTHDTRAFGPQHEPRTPLHDSEDRLISTSPCRNGALGPSCRALRRLDDRILGGVPRRALI